MQSSYRPIRDHLRSVDVLLDDELTELTLLKLSLRYQLIYADELLSPDHVGRRFYGSEKWSPQEGVLVYDRSTRRGRERMREQGFAYLSLDGHLYLKDHEQNVYVLFDSPIEASAPRRTRTRFYTKNDLKVLFAWLAQLPSDKGGAQATLALQAGVSEASVTRALDKLETNGYPRQRKRLRREETRALIQTWAEQYTQKLKPSLRKRRFRPGGGPPQYPNGLPEVPKGILFSGEAGARAIGHDLTVAATIDIYGKLDDVQTRLKDLRWIPSADGRFVIHEEFWGQPAEEWALSPEGRHFTIPLLTYADLLDTSDQRMMAVAEDVLDECLQLYRR